MRQRIKSAYAALAAEVGAGEVVLAAALGLIAYGASGWSVYAAAGAVGLVLLWIALPARRSFVIKPPAPPPAVKRKRSA